MHNVIIGSRQAFLSQLAWQVRHKWTRQRSLESWHEEHPDIPDDVFNELYPLAERCERFRQKCREPFCDMDKKLGDMWKEC